jgi:hypothetical protein
MGDRIRPRTQRGPLISSREILTNAELEADTALPWTLIADATAMVTHDLLTKVGYEHKKITITIEPLKKEHPQSPGYMIAAKLRRE